MQSRNITDSEIRVGQAQQPVIQNYVLEETNRLAQILESISHTVLLRRIV